MPTAAKPRVVFRVAHFDQKGDQHIRARDALVVSRARPGSRTRSQLTQAHRCRLSLERG